MQNFSKIIISGIMLNSVAMPEEPISFFMNDEDSIKALSLAKQSNTNDTEQTSNLKLSGIFFVDEQNWTIWINSKPYSEIGQHEDFSIDEVSESEVTITTSDGDAIILSVN